MIFHLMVRTYCRQDQKDAEGDLHVGNDSIKKLVGKLVLLMDELLGGLTGVGAEINNFS